MDNTLNTTTTTNNQVEVIKVTPERFAELRQQSKHQVKTDCFAFRLSPQCRGREMVCAALTELMCSHKNCPFYKSKNEMSHQSIVRSMKEYAKKMESKEEQMEVIVGNDIDSGS